MLCGLVGLDSRLSKLLLALNSVGVECAFELGRKFDGLLSSSDLPSSDRCSISWSGSRDVLLDDLCTADVSIVIVGALGLLAGPGDGDTRPAGGPPPFSAMLLRFLPHFQHVLLLRGYTALGLLVAFFSRIGQCGRFTAMYVHGFDRHKGEYCGTKEYLSLPTEGGEVEVLATSRKRRRCVAVGGVCRMG